MKAQAVKRVVGFLDDRANPIVVKEVRQGTRSRTFLIFFSLLLVGAMVTAALAPSSSSSELAGGQMGLKLFGWFVGILAIISFCAVPWMACRSVVVEREQNTFDLLQVSGLGPHRLVLGKLWATLVQLLIFFSAIAPFMALSFLLRGIDMVTILFVTLAIFLLSVQMSMGAIWLASMATTRAAAILLQVLLILVSVYLLSAIVAMMLSSDFLFVTAFWVGSTVPGGGSFWRALGSLLLWQAAWFFLLYALAVTMFKFEAANRSTLPRIALLGVILAHVVYAWAASDVGGVSFAEAWVRMAAPLMLLIYLGGVFAVTERRGLSRRVQRRVWANPLGQLWAAFFYPGPGRGFCFLLLCLVLAGLLPAIAGSIDGVADWIEPLWAAGYVLAYVGLAGGLVRLINRNGRLTPGSMRWLVVLFTLLAILLPTIGLAGSKAMGGWREPSVLLKALHPFWALMEDLYRDASADVVSTILLLLGVAAVAVSLPLVAGDLREQLQVGARNRARRQAAARATAD